MIEERWISFFSEGSRLIGNLFLPAGMQPGEERPGIVLCHGFTGVRQLTLPEYARRFAEADFLALIFDYRGFGESEGPKWRLLPLEQVDDIRNALTWLAAQPEVDPQRMGLWGTSFRGAHVPYVAGIDTRVKAAVAQVGFDTGERFLLSVRSESERADLQRQLEEDRRLRVTEDTAGGLTPSSVRYATLRRVGLSARPSKPIRTCAACSRGRPGKKRSSTGPSTWWTRSRRGPCC